MYCAYGQRDIQRLQAVRQEAERHRAINEQGTGYTTSGSNRINDQTPRTGTTGGNGNGKPPIEPKPPIRRKQRFYGKINLDPKRPIPKASTITQEVIQHLTALLDAHVEITLENHAAIPNEAPEATVRTVTENCRTLKFNEFGFEEK